MPCCSILSAVLHQGYVWIRSAARPRINTAGQPFEHEILAGDLVYRGMQCCHQYTPNNTLVDLVWKMEVCQILGDTKPQRPFAAGTFHPDDLAIFADFT
ncbi:Protein C06C3.4 [Aphelenchoides avenae]|nr:Protein C06C3.4 [Aphelenchus avenae]